MGDESFDGDLGLSSDSGSIRVMDSKGSGVTRWFGSRCRMWPNQGLCGFDGYAVRGNWLKSAGFRRIFECPKRTKWNHSGVYVVIYF